MYKVVQMLLHEVGWRYTAPGSRVKPGMTGRGFGMAGEYSKRERIRDYGRVHVVTALAPRRAVFPLVTFRGGDHTPPNPWSCASPTSHGSLISVVGGSPWRTRTTSLAAWVWQST